MSCWGCIVPELSRRLWVPLRWRCDRGEGSHGGPVIQLAWRKLFIVREHIWFWHKRGHWNRLSGYILILVMLCAVVPDGNTSGLKNNFPTYNCIPAFYSHDMTPIFGWLKSVQSEPFETVTGLRSPLSDASAKFQVRVAFGDAVWVPYTDIHLWIECCRHSGVYSWVVSHMWQCSGVMSHDSSVGSLHSCWFWIALKH